MPTGAVFDEAGETLRRLQSERGYNLARSHSIVNDVLIALSARASGAVVVTQNERDFRAIQAIRPSPAGRSSPPPDVASASPRGPQADVRRLFAHTLGPWRR